MARIAYVQPWLLCWLLSYLAPGTDCQTCGSFAKCPPEWEFLPETGNCYLLGGDQSEPLSMCDAARLCERAGSQLLVLDSYHEWQALNASSNILRRLDTVTPRGSRKDLHYWFALRSRDAFCHSSKTTMSECSLITTFNLTEYGWATNTLENCSFSSVTALSNWTADEFDRPWLVSHNKRQPSGDGDCTDILFMINKTFDGLTWNDVPCDGSKTPVGGYICKKAAKRLDSYGSHCSDQGANVTCTCQSGLYCNGSSCLRCQRECAYFTTCSGTNGGFQCLCLRTVHDFNTSLCQAAQSDYKLLGMLESTNVTDVTLNRMMNNINPSVLPDVTDLISRISSSSISSQEEAKPVIDLLVQHLLSLHLRPHSIRESNVTILGSSLAFAAQRSDLHQGVTVPLLYPGTNTVIGSARYPAILFVSDAQDMAGNLAVAVVTNLTARQPNRRRVLRSTEQEKTSVDGAGLGSDFWPSSVQAAIGASPLNASAEGKAPVEITLPVESGVFGKNPVCASPDKRSRWSDANCNPTSEHYITPGSVLTCECFRARATYALFSRLIDDSPILSILLDVNNSVVQNAHDLANKTTILEEATTAISTRSKGVGELLCEIVDRFADLNEVLLLNGQRKYNTSARSLAIINSYLSNVLLSVGEERQLARRHFAMVLFAWPKDRFFPETAFIVNNSSSQLSLRKDDVDEALSLTKTELASLVLPVNVTALAKPKYAHLPYVAVHIVAIANTSFFDSRSRNGASKSLASAVVAINVGAEPIQLDDDFVTVKFKILLNGTAPECVFWDFSLNGGYGGWNSSGCRLAQNMTESTISAVTCKCSHLTHFGVLIQLGGESQLSEAERSALKSITAVGSTVNVLCVLCLILLTIASRPLRRDIRTQILLHYCFALAMSSGLIALSFVATVHRQECRALAIFLHFFSLGIFSWMLVESFYLYRTLVAVYSREITNFMVKCAIFGWGVPALVVFLTMAASGFSLDNYGEVEDIKNLCFLRMPDQWYALYAPIAIAVFIATTCFAIICYNIWRKKADVERNQAKQKLSARQAVMAISLGTLLGVSWLAGLLMIPVENAAASQFLFSILQMITGILIFVFHIVLRKEFQKLVCKRRRVPHIQTSSENSTRKTVSISNIFQVFSRPSVQSNGKLNVPRPSNSSDRLSQGTQTTSLGIL